jgi:hypothetical protein
VLRKMIIEYPWSLIDRLACHERYSALGTRGMCKNVAFKSIKHIHSYFIDKYNNTPSVSEANI